jgi:hypothetical protein
MPLQYTGFLLVLKIIIVVRNLKLTCLNRDLFLSCALYVPLCVSLFLVSFGFHL